MLFDLQKQPANKIQLHVLNSIACNVKRNKSWQTDIGMKITTQKSFSKCNYIHVSISLFQLDDLITIFHSLMVNITTGKNDNRLCNAHTDTENTRSNPQKQSLNDKLLFIYSL